MKIFSKQKYSNGRFEIHKDLKSLGIWNLHVWNPLIQAEPNYFLNKWTLFSFCFFARFDEIGLKYPYNLLRPSPSLPTPTTMHFLQLAEQYWPIVTFLVGHQWPFFYLLSVTFPPEFSKFFLVTNINSWYWLKFIYCKEKAALATVMEVNINDKITKFTFEQNLSIDGGHSRVAVMVVT